MAKQQNMWVYVIIALIVGVLIGYAVAGGFAKSGKAVALKSVATSDDSTPPPKLAPVKCDYCHGTTCTGCSNGGVPCECTEYSQDWWTREFTCTKGPCTV